MGTVQWCVMDHGSFPPEQSDTKHYLQALAVKHGEKDGYALVRFIRFDSIYSIQFNSFDQPFN